MVINTPVVEEKVLYVGVTSQTLNYSYKLFHEFISPFGFTIVFHLFIVCSLNFFIYIFPPHFSTTPLSKNVIMCEKAKKIYVNVFFYHSHIFFVCFAYFVSIFYRCIFHLNNQVYSIFFYIHQ